MTRKYSILPALFCLALLFGTPAWAEGAPCRAGIDQYEDDQFDDAIATFTACIAAEGFTPKDEGLVYLYRAISYTNLGRVELAETDYLSAVNLNDDLQQVYAGLGHVFLSRGSFDAAVTLYDRAYRAHERAGLDISAAEGTWGDKADDGNQCKEPGITIALDLEARQYTGTYASGEVVSADLLAWSASALVLQYHDEDQLADDGEPVIWLLRLQEDNNFLWRRTDWTQHFAHTRTRYRCADSEIGDNEDKDDKDQQGPEGA